MVTRAVSTEDGNLNSKSIITSRNELYSDIDLLFENKTSGDVYKKNDAAAVKQAIKTLILTNAFEKPFNPKFGANLRSMLFELVDFSTSENVRTRIKETINRFEPRARVKKLDVLLKPDANSLDVRIEFQVVNTGQLISFTTNVIKVR